VLGVGMKVRVCCKGGYAKGKDSSAQDNPKH